jgi:transposase
LAERYGELFAAQYDVLLYDLTSSYVEGVAGKDPMMRRGYSRDHRPDCKQVVIALIVNVEGFPLSYETFDGNRADVTTLEAVLRMVERKYGKARRVWVFDRGIISEENLEALRRRGGQYLVGTPRAKLKQFEQPLLETDGWEQVRPEVEVKLVPTPQGEETYVLCRSTARREKELAIRSRFSTRLEKGLKALAKRVAEGKLKDRSKVERRLGSLLARHPQVADLYAVRITERAGRLQVDWNLREERRAWQQAREGAYLLRTNLPATEPEQLWKSYIQLTEAETAFRALKSELSIRPIFHQLERRAKAHILVAFLGYALWVTLKHLLVRKRSDLSPAKALHRLSTLQSADIILPTTDGREIRLRRITTPSREQQLLLDQLGVRLPERLSFDQECSADSAGA